MATDDPHELLRIGTEIYFWVDPCGVVMLKAVSPYGDPVEVPEGNLEELITLLQLSLKRLRADDAG